MIVLLDPGLSIMLTAVELNVQSSLMRVKVKYVSFEGNLPPEADAEALLAQLRPEEPFCICHVTT